MKKWIAVLLTMAFLLMLTACGGAPANSVAPTEVPSSAAETPASTPEPTQEPTQEPTSTPAEDPTPEPETELTEETEQVSANTTLVFYYDYSENMGDTGGMTADAITSASLAGEHYDEIERNNLLVMADEIANATGADTFSVRATEPYDPDYGNMVGVAKEDQDNNKQFSFVEDIDLSSYDTIFIGMPVWWSKLPQPMKVFVEQHDFSGKTLIPFGIHRGSRFGQMVGQLEDLTDAIVSDNGLSLNATTANAEVRQEVAEWLGNLGY